MPPRIKPTSAWGCNGRVPTIVEWRRIRWESLRLVTSTPPLRSIIISLVFLSLFLALCGAVRRCACTCRWAASRPVAAVCAAVCPAVCASGLVPAGSCQALLGTTGNTAHTAPCRPLRPLGVPGPVHKNKLKRQILFNAAVREARGPFPRKISVHSSKKSFKKLQK